MKKVVMAALAVVAVAALSGCAPRVEPIDSRDGDTVTIYKRAYRNEDNSLPPLPYFQQRAEQLCNGRAKFLDNKLNGDHYPIWYVVNRYTCER
ncbi:TPA: hypothetical protein QH074_004340 [Enterobacter hormaechei subsp. steigerwaltii]|nr:hypothetical protein [Enterobacter hormaechei subsp. steigerwaltii]